ncbi:hypothetical protein RB195_002679 [Necator americanus]|uniref:Uncharacterized protein n=1 Tax=Necator americanus TaxID=51031 RepID=A0ABR1DLK3_NECAM
MYARLRDIFELETLRDRFELQAVVERYAASRDIELAQEASRLFRENYGINKSSNIIPPFKIHFPSYFMTRSPNRISYCPIPKNMSTVITAIICWLFSEEFRNGNITLTGDHKRSCYYKNGLHAFEQVKKFERGEKWINFAMIREPQERFLSGFMFMCLPNNTVNSTCGGCVNDIKCALRTTLEQARRFAAGDLSARTYLLWHLGPQNWYNAILLIHKSSEHLIVRKVRVGVAALDEATQSISWPVCGGAIGMAIDRLHERGIATDFDFQIFTAPTTCNGDDAVGIGLGFMANSSVDAVIAPPCKMGIAAHRNQFL